MFQIILSVCLLLVLIIINRMYQGLRILNSRVDILSHLVKNLQSELSKTHHIDNPEFEEYLTHENLLQQQMSRDFTIDKKHLRGYRGDALLRSNIELKATESIPSSKKRARFKNLNIEHLPSQSEKEQTSEKIIIHQDLEAQAPYIEQKRPPSPQDEMISSPAVMQNESISEELGINGINNSSSPPSITVPDPDVKFINVSDPEQKLKPSFPDRHGSLLSSYQVENGGRELEIKSDFSYIVTSSDNTDTSKPLTVEQIPSSALSPERSRGSNPSLDSLFDFLEQDQKKKN